MYVYVHALYKYCTRGGVRLADPITYILDTHSETTFRMYDEKSLISFLLACMDGFFLKIKKSSFFSPFALPHVYAGSLYISLFNV